MAKRKRFYGVVTCGYVEEITTAFRTFHGDVHHEITMNLERKEGTQFVFETKEKLTAWIARNPEKHAELITNQKN